MHDVLIAADDVDAWFQVNAMLRKHFIKASFVSSLQAARKYMEEHIPSILFFDKKLTDNSATDFISWVRSKYPQAKIIMTNNNDEWPEGFKSRADMYIGKPIAPETIERSIVKLLAHQN